MPTHRTTTIPISDALGRRAQLVINDSSIDPQWRTIIRYALELDDPWLPDLLRCAGAGENIADIFESLRTLETNEDDSTEDKIKALVCWLNSSKEIGSLQNDRSQVQTKFGELVRRTEAITGDTLEASTKV